jgi:serine/threonine protein kinase
VYHILLPSSYRTDKCEGLFEFGDKLGCGNFAHVYKGVEKTTGRTIAIKSIFYTRYANKPKVLHAIIQEVSTLMSLESHVSSILFDTCSNMTYFILAFYYKNGKDVC